MRGSESPGDTPAPKRTAARIQVHLVRFVVLVVGLLVVSELILIFSCVVPSEYVTRTLRDIAECAGTTLFFLVWIGLDYLAIRLIPVVILALMGTIFWGLYERRQS